MSEYDDWLKDAEQVIEELRQILTALEQGQITPRAVMQQFDARLGNLLFVKEAEADSWHLFHLAGVKGTLPRGNKFVSCSRTAAHLFSLEAACYAVASDVFVELGAWDDAKEFYGKAADNLRRAEEHLGELKWHRRWFTYEGRRLVGVEDVRNSIRGVRDAIEVINGFIQDHSIEVVNDHIEKFNVEVVGEVVKKLCATSDGQMPQVDQAKLTCSRHVLVRLQIDLTGYRSSWSVLCAMESIAMSAAVLDWARYQRDRNHLYAPMRRGEAVRDLVSADQYRRRRRAYRLWFVLKALYRTLSREVAPKWSEVLPRGRELRSIRAKVKGWLDRGT